MGDEIPSNRSGHLQSELENVDMHQSSSGAKVLEMLISDWVHRQFGEEIESLDPEVTTCVLEGASASPEPVSPRVLLQTGDISGQSVAGLLERYPSIEWIQVASAGIEVALPHLNGYQGIVTNMTGLHSEAVSEWVFAMVLAHTRRLSSVFANSQQGRWQREVGDEVAGKTLGVVGAGWVGTSVASKARAFGMDVIGIRKSGRPVTNFCETYGPDRLSEVLKRSHYLLVSVPLTSETRGLIGNRAFEGMRNDAVLINVARGAVVDTKALVHALDRAAIAGAILDVTDPEPLPDWHPLWRMPGVVISAHSAWLSIHSRRRIVNLFSENFRRWMVGKPMHNVVDLKREY